MHVSRTRTALAAAIIGLTALAGCSKSEPERAPDMENSVVEAVPEAPPAPAPTRDVAPEPVPPAAVDANDTAEAEPEVSPDAQMLEDADATGMTARVTRDEAPANDEDPQ